MFPVKRFLLQCRSAMIEIEILREHQQAVRATLLPKAVQLQPVDVQTSTPGDMMASRIAEIDEIERDIEALMQSLICNRRMAMRVIMGIESSVCRQVLELYYLDPARPSWAVVADRMGYSERQIYNIHGEALVAAQKVFEALQ